MRNAETELDPALFQNPTGEYRGIPFWSWNGRITREQIDRDLEIFQKMGFGGVDIHPRVGLDTAYLGEEFMELIRYAVDRCKEMGIVCWLYDDDRFPSGAADGMVTQNMAYRGRYLLLTEQELGGQEGICDSRESFEEAVQKGEKPRGYYLTAYRIVLKDGVLAHYERLRTSEAVEQARWKEGRLRFAYLMLLEESSAFEGQTYVDTMNPEAIREFVHVTHETYANWIGEEFGETLQAIFTDEPRIGKHTLISRAESEEDVTLPYTEYLADQMRRKWAMDPLDKMPECVWQLPEGEWSVFRYRYLDMASECFTTAYMDQIAAWCKEHRIAMTGHVLGEDHLAQQSASVGDCMRCYRSMDLPGIDILRDQRQFITVKQAASVARQNGQPGVVSEMYGVTHWDCDFKAFKLQGDWQAALGITIRVPHLSHMSLGGEAKRDWPGSLSFQQPWYERFSLIEDHFARLNTILSRGTAKIRIGVIHPVESLWMYMGPEDQTGEIRQEMDEDFTGLTEWLLRGGFDFDYLSEALLPSQCQEEGTNPLQVGRVSYDVVLVPNLVTIRRTTLDLLDAFHKQGGRVLFMGRIPELVDGEPNDVPQALAKECVCLRQSRNDLYKALEDMRTADIRKESGMRADHLLCQMREDGEVKWLYICHADRMEMDLAEEVYTIRVRGTYRARIYDTQSGKIGPACFRHEGTDTILTWRAYAEDSVVFCLSAPEETDEGAEPDRQYEPQQRLSVVRGYVRQEANALLLDHPKWQLDGGILQGPDPILKIDEDIRKKLGYALRGEHMFQPYMLAETETHRVTLHFYFYSHIALDAFLALEEAAVSRVRLNGQSVPMEIRGYYVDPAIQVIALPGIQQGDNLLSVDIQMSQKTNLENMWILGEFDVDLAGMQPEIHPMRPRLRIGDITRQGLPFYTGNLDLTVSFAIREAGEYSVRIPHFCAPLLGVWVDEEPEIQIAYAPHRAELGWLVPGKHQLTVRIYGNRFNGLGTLHIPWKNWKWYGPDSFRTQGEDFTECYQVRPVGLLSGIILEKVTNQQKEGNF